MGPGVLKRRGLLVESKVGGLIVHLHYLFVGKAALPMSDTWRVSPDEVDQLLRNAELRDKLEPYLDDAVGQVNVSAMPTHIENEYLESMLAWEHAPVMPIGKWFEPELQVPDPHSLDDRALHQVLWRTIEQLFQQRIVLDFGDHLSDRELYTLIYRDIVPAKEKKILAGGQIRIDSQFLGDQPDQTLGLECSSRHRHPTHGHGTRVGAKQPRDHRDRRGLSRTVGA